MRSFSEVQFRVSQELHNLLAYIRPPRLPEIEPPPAPFRCFADPRQATARADGTEYATELIRIADAVLRHEFPIFGGTLSTGPAIAWRRDYVNGKELGLDYVRRVPYLDFERAGDHKQVWELNRHQHLVVLAQAFLLTRRVEYLREIEAEIADWITANPPLRGMNWTSALEVAFRALSWIWVYHLVGPDLDRAFIVRLLNAVYQHASYLEHNLSVYFSPNTHLLGEAVALHAIGRLFALMPGARRWAEHGARVVAAEMERQVRDDGSHFEQSAYYHVYAMDFFLLHGLLIEEMPSGYADKLARMGEFLQALMGPARVLPLIGDDDGGRLFHPYGSRSRFGRATLTALGTFFGRPEWIGSAEDFLPLANWWLPRSETPTNTAGRPRESRLFRDSGIAVFESEEMHAVLKAGGFGPWGAGHSHSDVFSLTATVGQEEVLIDPGAYTYVSDPQWRNWFRGSGAHNTVRVDGLDQATAAGPFRWAGLPEARIQEWSSVGGRRVLDAECRYAPFTHRRRVVVMDPDVLIVFDVISGEGAGAHTIEQLWHPGEPVQRLSETVFRIGSRTCLTLLGGTVGESAGWRSPVFGSKVESPVLRSRVEARLPVVLGAVMEVGRTGEWRIEAAQGRVLITGRHKESTEF